MSDRDWVERLRGLHARIVRGVRDVLEQGALGRGGDPGDAEGRVVAEGAGDVSFAVDVPAEAEIEAFAHGLAAGGEAVRVVCEGIGERDFLPPAGHGGGAPATRLVFDPVDGTRPLMMGLRSGFTLAAVADERGDATSLSDVRVAVQTEIPGFDRSSYVQCVAVRGEGAFWRRVALDDGRVLAERRLEPSSSDRLGNGVYSFFKFEPGERVTLARIEADVLEALVDDHGVDPRTLQDDQYTCNAGQLYLVLTQRYRMVADLRAYVGDVLGRRNFTTKPYDVCCALLCSEAGVPLTDERGAPLDARLALDGRVSFVAYANDAVRKTLEPLLAAALRRFEASARA